MVPDWLQLACEPKMPPGWRWCRSQILGDGSYLMSGQIPTTYKRGPKKGKPKFGPASKDTKCVLTRDEIDAVKARWSSETGKCHHCGGTGQVLYAWCKEHVKETKVCKHCGGTGDYK